jgi:hypothetical protein
MLSLSSANRVDLSALVNDADANPTNEIQSLSINGNTLSISSGNSITLPNSTTNAGSEFWMPYDNNSVSFKGNKIVLLPEEGDNPMIVLGNSGSRGGYYEQWNMDGELSVYMASNEEGTGDLYLLASDEVVARIFSTKAQGGGMATYDTLGNIKVLISTTGEGTGYNGTYGANGLPNFVISHFPDEPNKGVMEIRDENNRTKLGASITSNNYGRIYTRGPNEKTNVNITALNGNSNNGYISVNDSQGNEEAGIYVDQDGRGVVFGDIKNFKTPHPLLEDYDILYASLEGPEAGAYLRGTAQLVKGKATIDFPDHFQYIISDKSLTVMLTPLSAESNGLAVVKKDKLGFEVQELLSGQGTYQFDWEIKGIRAGYESYEVIRKRDSVKPSRDTDLHKSAERNIYIPKQ